MTGPSPHTPAGDALSPYARLLAIQHQLAHGDGSLSVMLGQMGVDPPEIADLAKLAARDALRAGGPPGVRPTTEVARVWLTGLCVGWLFARHHSPAMHASVVSPPPAAGEARGGPRYPR